MSLRHPWMGAALVALSGAAVVAAPPLDTTPSTPSAPSVQQKASDTANSAKSNAAQTAADAPKSAPSASGAASGSASGSGSANVTPPKSPAATNPPKSPAATEPGQPSAPSTPPKSPAAPDAPSADVKPMPLPNGNAAPADIEAKTGVDAKAGTQGADVNAQGKAGVDAKAGTSGANLSTQGTAGANATTDSPAASAQTKTGADVNANANTNTDANVNANTNTNTNANTNVNSNTNTNTNTNTNVNANANVDANTNANTNTQLNAQANISQDLQTRVASAIGLGFAQAADAIRLSTIQPNSVFADVGFVPGDQIVSINGRQLASQSAFVRYLYNVPVGQRVPIVVMRNGTQQTLYWTPSPQFVQMLPPLPQGGFVRGGPVTAQLTYVPGRKIGIEMDTRFSDRTIVTDVVEGSPADQAGVMIGDQITALNNQPIGGPANFLDQLHALPAQAPVHLSLARSGDAPAAVTAERVVPQPVVTPQPGVVTPPVIGRDGDPGRGVPGDPRGPIRRAIRP